MTCKGCKHAAWPAYWASSGIGWCTYPVQWAMLPSAITKSRHFDHLRTGCQQIRDDDEHDCPVREEA